VLVRGEIWSVLPVDPTLFLDWKSCLPLTSTWSRPCRSPESSPSSSPLPLPTPSSASFRARTPKPSRSLMKENLGWHYLLAGFGIATMEEVVEHVDGTPDRA